MTLHTVYYYETCLLGTMKEYNKELHLFRRKILQRNANNVNDDAFCCVFFLYNINNEYVWIVTKKKENTKKKSRQIKPLKGSKLMFIIQSNHHDLNKCSIILSLAFVTVILISTIHHVLPKNVNELYLHTKKKTKKEWKGTI